VTAAGPVAIRQGDDAAVIAFIYDERKAFPTFEAIQAAREQKNVQLEAKLKELRRQQITAPPTSLNSYTLLTQFDCIKRGDFRGYDYFRQIAHPVIKRIRYDSIVGNILSGVLATPLRWTQACPK